MLPYILMLQADPDDRLITESALLNMQKNVLIHYRDSYEDLAEIITQSGSPVVILLNDQGASHPGGELLRKIKSHPEYCYIPVVILGEYSTPEYIRKCYKEGASTFITKPTTVKQTQEKIEKFFSYWLEVAES